MTKVFAIHRIQRRVNGKRRFIPAGGVFETEGKEYSHLLENGAIRNATRAEIAAAEENPELRERAMPARARTLKEQEAIARATKLGTFGKPADSDEDTIGSNADDRDLTESESEEAQRKADESIDAAKKEEARQAAEAEEQKRAEAEAAAKAKDKGGKTGKKNLV